MKKGVDLMRTTSYFLVSFFTGPCDVNDDKIEHVGKQQNNNKNKLRNFLCCYLLAPPPSPFWHR